jgi:integrase
MRGVENPKPYRPAPVNAASDAEIVALMGTLDDSRVWPCTRLAIEFQLVTGARPSEVRLATWSEVRLDRQVWVIPATRVKSGREFKVHLSSRAVVLLHEAKALNSATSDYVFPGANGGAMDKMAVARSLARLADRLNEQGGKRLRPHDLRRTFRTLLSRIGVAPHIAELCMNHQETETMRRVYDGHDYGAEMAEAWDRASTHLTAICGGGAQVIPMIGKRA